MSSRLYKTLALNLILILLVVTLSCNRGQALVYFLNFKPEVAKVYEDVAKAYEDETGVKVKVVTASAGTYEDTLTSEVLKTNQPTIFQVNGPIGYSKWKEYCYDLKNTNLYKTLIDKTIAITENGNVYGIPFAIEGYGLVYNKTVFSEYFAQDNKATSLNNVDEITNFNQFKEIVVDLDKYIKGEKPLKNAPSIEKLEGVFASTSLSSGSQWPYQTHLANIPFYYEFLEKNPDNAVLGGLDIKTGEFEFKYNQEFKNVFDLYLNYGVKEKTTLGTVTTNYAATEFGTGKAAILQQGNWIYNEISKITEGNVITKDNIGMMPIYIGHENEETLTIPVGTENYFCVNKKVSQEKIDASIKFLEWLFSSETGKDFLINKLGFIAPFTTFTADEKPQDPLAKEVLRLMEMTNRTTIPWAFTAIPSDEFKNEFGGMLLLYAQGQKTWEDVVNKVKEVWVVK